LHHRLAIPRKIRRVLRQAEDLDPTPAALRIMRFDFHPTTDGWQISEVNSDVPGGFTESSNFTSMVAEHYPGTKATGNPGEAWTKAMLESVDKDAAIALLSAPGFMEDQQIVSYLRNQLRARGCRTLLVSPEQLTWRDGLATMNSSRYQGMVGAIVRFYQSEWMARLPGRCGWSHFFFGGKTPVVNPGTAILTESKRLPLVWDDLTMPLSTWRSLLPETCDPRDVRWKTDESWLLKSAFCNTGDTVSHRSLLTEKAWTSICREVHRFPGQWVAQRKFNVLPVETPLGSVFPCVGVYTINGRTTGAYGRIGHRHLIDFEAIDVAILVEGGDYQ
jgi:glutathionylspermidine synthase